MRCGYEKIFKKTNALFLRDDPYWCSNPIWNYVAASTFLGITISYCFIESLLIEAFLL